MSLDCAASRFTEWLQIEFPATQSKHAVQCYFALQSSRLRMDNRSVQNEDSAPHLAGKNLEHGGFAAQTLELQHFLQTDAPHYPMKTILGAGGGKAVQCCKNCGKTVGRNQFLKKQSRTAFHSQSI
jgi:hypothetical protein